MWMALVGCPFVFFLPAIAADHAIVPNQSEVQVSRAYALGPDDQIRIWVLGLEDIFDKPVRVGANGRVDLPLIGPTQALGLTAEELGRSIATRLESQLKHPQVSVTVVEFGSQPVSVLGAVNTPGVHQLQGRRTLAEVLSMAGGLRADAGPIIKISRQIEQLPIPLDSAKPDSSGRYSTAEVKVQDILQARVPEENILIQPHDVITVPQGEMIYVIGAVRKPGPLILHESTKMSVLNALSLAEGLGPTPAPQNSRILRTVPGTQQRTEIPVNLNKVLSGKAENIDLQANDILLIPTSNAKKAGLRAIEAALQAGTIAAWGLF